MVKINKNCKIGIVSDTFLPQIGGAEIHINNLAKFLKKDDYSVEIFTNTPGENEVGGIKVKRNRGYGLKLFRFLKDIKNLWPFINSHDLIHAHYSFYLSFLSVLIGRVLKKPVVITLHGLGTLDSSMTNYRRKFFRYFSLKMANAIIATSDEMAEVALRFNKKKKIFIVPNAVDTEFFKSKKSEEKSSKIIVLSMRRLNPKNGVQYLVEAIPYIVKEIREIEFLIIGKERLERYLKERVRDLGIEKFVRFIDEIPNQETLDYYNRADIIVFPSSAEFTSVACLEAMACQKAVIASSLSAYKEMLGQSERGILVELFDRDYSDYNAPLNLSPEKIKKLAKGIIKLSRDKDIRTNLGLKARDFVVKEYDWKVIIKKIEKIYFNSLN